MDTNTTNPFNNLSIKELNERLFKAIEAPSFDPRCLQLIEDLVKAGAEIEALVDGRTQTPLMYAAYASNNILIFKKLISLGANIHAISKDHGNITVLMHAVLSNNLAAIHELVQHNVDIHQKDDLGYSAFDYACLSGNKTEIIYYLLSHMFATNNFSSYDSAIHTRLKISSMNNFENALKEQRKKLCTLLFSGGLPHHAVMERPLSPTENTELPPELVKQIFALKALSIAKEFPEWYVLSCLHKDINFFLNWKPAPKPKGYGESFYDSVMTFSETTQNTFSALFEKGKTYLASASNAPTKRKREDNDENNQNAEPENNKKRRLD